MGHAKQLNGVAADGPEDEEHAPLNAGGDEEHSAAADRQDEGDDDTILPPSTPSRAAPGIDPSLDAVVASMSRSIEALRTMSTRAPGDDGFSRTASDEHADEARGHVC